MFNPSLTIIGCGCGLSCCRGNDVVGGVILGCFFDLPPLTGAALVDASFDLDGFLQVFL